MTEQKAVHTCQAWLTLSEPASACSSRDKVHPAQHLRLTLLSDVCIRRPHEAGLSLLCGDGCVSCAGDLQAWDGGLKIDIRGKLMMHNNTQDSTCL